MKHHQSIFPQQIKCKVVQTHYFVRSVKALFLSKSTNTLKSLPKSQLHVTLSSYKGRNNWAPISWDDETDLYETTRVTKKKTIITG